MEAADSIFIGYAKKIFTIRDERAQVWLINQHVQFIVVDSWKGPKPSRRPFEVRTRNKNRCGSIFTKGEKFLVFAKREGEVNYTLPGLQSIPFVEAEQWIEELENVRSGG